MASDAFYEGRLRTEIESVRQSRIQSGASDSAQANTLSPLGACLEPRTASGKPAEDIASRNTTGASSNGLSDVDQLEPELNILAFLAPSRDASGDDGAVAILRDLSDGLTATISDKGLPSRDDSASSTKPMQTMVSVQRMNSGKKIELSFESGIRYLEVPSPKVELVEDLAMVDQDYPWLVMGQVPKEKLLAMNVLAIVAEDLQVEVFNAAFAGRCLIRFQVKMKEDAEILRQFSGFYRFWGGKLVCASNKEEAQMLEQLETAGLREASHCIQFEYAEKKGTAPLPLVPKTAAPQPSQNAPQPNQHHMNHHHGYHHVQGSPPMYNPRMNQGLPHYAVAGGPMIGVNVNYGMGMGPVMMAPPPPPPPAPQNPANAPGQGRTSSGSSSTPSAGTTSTAPSGTTAAPVKSTVALNPAATPFTPGVATIPPLPVSVEQQPWGRPSMGAGEGGVGKGKLSHPPAPSHHPKSGGIHAMGGYPQQPLPEPYFQALPFPSPLPIPKAQPTQPANPGFPAQAKDMKPVQPLPKQQPPEPAPLTSVCGNVFGGGLFGPGGLSSMQNATYDPFQSPGLIEAQKAPVASTDRGTIGRPNRNRARNH